MPLEYVVVSYCFCYIMRSHSDMWTGLRRCIVHQQPYRWGRKIGTDHVQTIVQEITSHISRTSGTNSVTNVNVVLFLYNISVGSFFLGWLCHTERAVGSCMLTELRHSDICSFSACQEGELTSACMGLP